MKTSSPQNGRLNRNAWQGVFVSLLCFAMTAVAGENPIIFKLKCPQPELSAGRKPKCCCWVADGKGYETVRTDAAFGRDGVCTLSLGAGSYRFELLALDRTNNRILAIRSGPVRVSETNTAFKFPAIRTVDLSVSLDGVPLNLEQVAVRSIGETGEVRWKQRKPKDQAPALWLSEDKTLQLCLVGGAGDATVAAWKRLTVSSNAVWEVPLAAADFNVCHVTVDPASPPINSGKAWFVFPDCTVDFPLKGGQRFFANRRDGLFGYDQSTDNERHLRVVDTYTVMGTNVTLNVGGALHAKPWALALPKTDKENYLEWRGSLVDVAGREVDLKASSIGYQAQLSFADGRSVSSGPLPDAQARALAKSTASLLCDISWAWAGGGRFRGAPEEPDWISSQHFKMKAPSVWTQKAQNYLNQLEQTMFALKKITGRNGPDQIKVDWRLDTGEGTAHTDGKNARMHVSFDGLRLDSNPYGSVEWMTSDMILTFGYEHGKIMDAAVKAADGEEIRLRWKRVDKFME